MKLHFNCPICATDLQLSTTVSVGPCPSCQNTLQVEIKVHALVSARREESPDERRVENWRCSGKPHGTFFGSSARA